jgi:hypothetical protein
MLVTTAAATNRIHLLLTIGITLALGVDTLLSTPSGRSIKYPEGTLYGVTLSTNARIADLGSSPVRKGNSSMVV